MGSSGKMGAFLLLVPLLASATCVSAHVYLLTPEQVHAAYHNHGALHSHTQPDGTVIFFEDHTHMPYYYNMNTRDLYSDYLLAMWLNDDSYSINIQSGLVNPNDDGADSFNQFLLTHGNHNRSLSKVDPGVQPSEHLCPYYVVFVRSAGSR